MFPGGLAVGNLSDNMGGCRKPSTGPAGKCIRLASRRVWPELVLQSVGGRDPTLGACGVALGICWSAWSTMLGPRPLSRPAPSQFLAEDDRF